MPIEPACSVMMGMEVTRFQPVAFHAYAERVLELFNHVFSPMYARVFKEKWHDGSFFAHMPRNYCRTDWQSMRYEAYWPVTVDAEGFMRYYRITVKVVAELDPWILRECAAELERPLLLPNGIVREQTIIVVAQRRKGRGFVKAYKNGDDTLVTAFIHRCPEIAVKRVLCVIANFIEKRLKALLKKLNVEPHQIDYISLERLHHSLLYNIIESYSLIINRMVRSLSHGLCWLKEKLKEVLFEIGRQNMLKTRALKKTLERVRELVMAFKRVPDALKAVPDPPLLKRLEGVLAVEAG